MKNSFRFLKPGRLVDADLELVASRTIPADPVKKYVPCYEFELRETGKPAKIASIRLRIGRTRPLIGRKVVNACTHCGRCIDVCPAGAFRNGSFDGLACRDKMRELARTPCDGSFCFECELCLRACPVGTQPREIEVRFKQ